MQPVFRMFGLGTGHTDPNTIDLIRGDLGLGEGIE